MVTRIVLLTLLLPAVAAAQLEFEREPINYSDAEPTDRVSQLEQHLVDGTVTLAWDHRHGYLKALLQRLDIPVSSQTLVFSKTSLQISRISPRTPRAIYFSDDVYVGWVQQGDMIEVSAADPQLGATFYTLSQQVTDSPVLKRETSRCLQCHGSSHTRRTPGHIVRSVFSERSGQPVYRLGTHISDDRSPFRERFGGWYVSGTHGDQRHMGNVWLADPEESEILDTEKGANLKDLSAVQDVTPYLSPHSDLVALMVLQHQAHMHNVLTAANHSGRLTARDAEIMNRTLERDAGYESESTQRRYASAAEKVVQALLFCGEAGFTSPVQGTSEFCSQFESRGPLDARGRSLRHFDLQQRLFRFPCSFLIYSEAFRGLPEGVMIRVRKRLNEVLSGTDSSEVFSHLTVDDRLAIKQILESTNVVLHAGDVLSATQPSRSTEPR